MPTAEVEFHGALGYALRVRGGGGDGDAAGRARAEPHDGDGQRLALRRRDDGPRHRAAVLPRVARSGRTTGGCAVGCSSTSRSCASSSSTCSVELEAAMALGFECALASRRDDGDRLRRILVPGGQGAALPLRRRGGERDGRAVRRQRLLRGLGPDPAAPRRAVPSHLGRQRERVRPRRASGHAQRRRARSASSRASTTLSRSRAGAPPFVEPAADRDRGGERRARTPDRRRARARTRRVRGTQRGARGAAHRNRLGRAPARARGRRSPQGAGRGALRAPAPHPRQRVERPHRGGRGP